jgi:hypothetical protein
VRFCHILTSIPVGSRVYVMARARFMQFDEVVMSGAIGIVGSPEAYPIKISIRPDIVQGIERGGMKSVVNPSEWAKPITEHGGTYDLVITDAKQFNPGQIVVYERFDPKVGPSLTVHQVRAEPSKETDVINRYLCETCGTDLGAAGRRFCDNCTVRVLTCEHPQIGATSLRECGNPLYPGYGACEEHLKFLGIAYKKRKGRPLVAKSVPKRPRGPSRPKPQRPPTIVVEEEPVCTTPGTN